MIINKSQTDLLIIIVNLAYGTLAATLTLFLDVFAKADV
ncbi:hypothetical protein WDC_0283 [Paucilactobacillus wasatchensis]|uniref:Uncharacterized protein n=1 Tax=Paucilactobacillus wasatchensis TaxID=1335616 RepID=A0A0D1ABP7_9LACO|nr:hypothetical protein WDC_0283 [Paucilactobacillus wasatchensis]